MALTGSEARACNSRLETFCCSGPISGEARSSCSSSGFCLPEGSILSPDDFVIRLDRLQALRSSERHNFALFCPDFVVDLASPSYECLRAVTALRRRIAAY